MDIARPLQLLGGLTPQQFVKRHWQRRPLVVRGAWPQVRPPVSRAALFALAARDDVESRLVVQTAPQTPARTSTRAASPAAPPAAPPAARQPAWSVRHGPLARRALPKVAQPAWTLLVQGLDLHVDAARRMLDAFRFLPEARLDDLMVSWASDGGGVGPHVDAYDVFLLQVQGRRRWRIGRARDTRFVEGLALRILAQFEPEEEHVLEPGDLLYLPPMWGHDGIAEGECMTCSVGFRTPDEEGLAEELLQRLADASGERGRLYRDPPGCATAQPAALPEALLAFARAAVQQRLADADAFACALGELLTEPKPKVWFAAGDADRGSLVQGVRLARASRMLYDARHVYLNGESWRAGGRDARLLRRLADERQLAAPDCAALSDDARQTLETWLDDGWLEALAPPAPASHRSRGGST